jgi:hypothetical protein
MKTKDLINRLKNIDTKDLSNVMNVRPDMARKYKREPWKYDPPTSKAIEVELAFGIPVYFWKDIKSFTNESITSIPDNKLLPTKGEK